MKAASTMSNYQTNTNFNPSDIKPSQMVMIEEDEDRVAEDSCTEGKEESYKENQNRISNKRVDDLYVPRALKNK